MEDKTIEEIEERIEDLREHAQMWARAGGVGGNMAMRAMSEIRSLELKKQDLLNGTSTYKIDQIRRDIERLKILRAEASILKKLIYSRQIKQKEEELSRLQSNR